jgi:hypothetical protein
MRKLLFLLYLVISLCQATPVLAYPQESVPSPVAGSISSPFGWRVHPITGKNRFHSGLDIAASRGTPIYAVQPGWVVFSGTYAGYGNLVVIEHADGLHTWYGHSSVILKQSGEWVNAGDNIALVGSTGNSTGPHLHFEVRIRGEAVDPLQYLATLAQPLNTAQAQFTSNSPSQLPAHLPAPLPLPSAAAPPPPMPQVNPQWVGPTTKAIGSGSVEQTWTITNAGNQQSPLTSRH